MNYQWMGQATACPVVEFHDVRTEKFRSERYLRLVEERLAGPLAASGVACLGQFRVENHPDRLLLVRGYLSMPARRRALTAFYAGEDWARHRDEATALVHEHKVTLTRSVAPGEGVRSIQPVGPARLLLSEVRFAEQVGNYHLWLRLLLRKAGLDPLAAFATLEAVNDVPAVPVVRNRSQHIALLPGSDGAPQLPPELRGMLRYAPETLVLEPVRALVW